MDARLQNLGVARGRFALALSGGADSTALLHLLKPDVAFIVDHGLRPESSAEAALVKSRSPVETHILRWEGVKPTTGLMEAARHARYALLLEACYQHHCSHLFVAHHQDDHIETYVMRKERGSGWRGLAGMPWVAERAGVMMVRPLLDVPKVALLDFCAKNNLAYVDDPTNSNPAFARARVRMETQDRDSILKDIAANAERRQTELQSFWRKPESMANGLVDSGFRQNDEAFVSAILSLHGQQDHPPSRASVQTLLAKKAGTLAGCRVWTEKEQFCVTREAAAIAPLELGQGTHDMLWDRRMRLCFEVGQPCVLAPLRTGAWRHLPEVAEWVEAIPAPARAALPALWRDNKVVALLRGVWQPYYNPLVQTFWLPQQAEWLRVI